MSLTYRGHIVNLSLCNGAPLETLEAFALILYMDNIPLLGPTQSTNAVQCLMSNA